jgi:hypothetical protein
VGGAGQRYLDLVGDAAERLEQQALLLSAIGWSPARRRLMHRGRHPARPR